MSLRGFAAILIVGQTLQPQACGNKPQPPASDQAITNQFTTTDGIRLGVQTIVSNVEIPWSLAFAPDGRLFFTERPGRVRVVQSDQLVATPALVLSDVRAVGEGGLLGIALHPQFANNHFVYLLYTTTGAAGV